MINSHICFVNYSATTRIYSMSLAIKRLSISQYANGFIDVNFHTSHRAWNDGGFCILPWKLTRTKFDSIMNILYSNHKYGDMMGSV